MTRCICRFDTNACTAPDSENPSTSAHNVPQNMKNASRNAVDDVSRRHERDQADAHERTSRAIAADASAIFSSAAVPPSPMASATQWARC